MCYTFLILNTKFGRLTVIATAPKRATTRHSFWLCRCDCGIELIVDAQNLKNGHSQSCGCLRQERSKQASTKHGKTGSSEFIIWVSMRQRCSNANTKAFKDYGARGMYVDARWDTFEQFFKDMGPRQDTSFTLERIDNNGPYSPENCCWAPKLVQANNTRKNRIITFDARSQTIAQWARETGIRRSTLWMRLFSCNWSIDKALTK